MAPESKGPRGELEEAARKVQETEEDLQRGHELRTADPEWERKTREWAPSLRKLEQEYRSAQMRLSRLEKLSVENRHRLVAEHERLWTDALQAVLALREFEVRNIREVERKEVE